MTRDPPSAAARALPAQPGTQGIVLATGLLALALVLGTTVYLGITDTWAMISVGWP